MLASLFSRSALLAAFTDRMLGDTKCDPMCILVFCILIYNVFLMWLNSGAEQSFTLEFGDNFKAA